MWRRSLLAALLGTALTARGDHRHVEIERDPWVHDLDAALRELDALETVIAHSNDFALRSQGRRHVKAIRRVLRARLGELSPRAPQPPQPQPAGLFAETFDDNRQGWAVGSDGLCEADIDDGTLALAAEHSAKGKNCRYWWPFARDLDAFRAEFDATYDDGPETFGYGLVFRARGSAPFHTYLVMVNAQGKAAIFGYGRTWSALAPWQTVPGLRTGRATNRLAVDVGEGFIRLIANDVPAAEARVAPLMVTQLGFYLDVARLEATFDNLVVYPAPALPPTPTAGPPAPMWPTSPPAQAPTPPGPPVLSPAAGAPPPSPVPSPSYGAAEADLHALHAALQAVVVPTERKLIAIEFAAYRPLTTEQAAGIVRVFVSPSDQVEVAAGLYPAVVDPQNWFQMYAWFPAPWSADQLRRWVASIDAQGKPPRRPPGRPGAGPAFPDPSFRTALRAVAGVSATRQKMAILTDLVRNNFFTAAQAAELMHAFIASSDRRAAGITLWPRLVDPENTYLLFAAAPGLQEDLRRAYVPR